MANLVEKISSIESRVGNLLRAHDSLGKEKLELKTELSTQEEKIMLLKDEIESLKNNNQSLKTANALLGSNDFKRETKFKINKMIREIDLCISQISE